LNHEEHEGISWPLIAYSAVEAHFVIFASFVVDFFVTVHGPESSKPQINADEHR